MTQTLIGISIAIVLVALGLLRGAHRNSTTWTVEGNPDLWLQRCNDTLEAMPHVSDVRVDEDRRTIAARHRRPGAWARLTVSITAADPNSTKVTITISVIPTPLTGIIRPEPRIVDRFSTQVGIVEHAVRQMPAAG
jgi:hypothetical protein